MKAIKRKDYLNLLAQSKTPKRRKLLANWATKRDIDAISEIALNTLNGNIKLSNPLYKKLYKDRSNLRSLASKSCSVCKKKNIIAQQGGFLSFLIPAAFSVISSLFKKK